MRGFVTWSLIALLISVPLILAATSPFLAWRGPVYIAACFAGIGALGLMLIQPLLAGGKLPGIPAQPGRQTHRIVGIALLCLVLIHVGGLWITSPPDMVDALLFNSPTPFSAWGVAAMWALFAAALIATLRSRFRPVIWRVGHTALVCFVVLATALHAILIEGIMEMVSKAILSLAVIGATLKVAIDLKAWRLLKRR